MIDTVKAMFPHIPVAAIQYDLQKTGSVELTCENVLRDGTLPMPPSSRPSTPSSASGSTIGRNAGVGSSTGAAGSSSTATASGSSTSQNVNLLHRYGLSDHAARNYVPEEPTKEWADTAEKRQQIFKSRKEFMILQARKKLLEEEERKKQEEEEKAKNAAAATAASSESIQA
ncbi:hypothetical protein BGW41_001228 [Actinomortierella wolfii]|nr:hypothetical protein BGW41_001228 [Actinomortierella wolfii]